VKAKRQEIKIYFVGILQMMNSPNQIQQDYW